MEKVYCFMGFGIFLLILIALVTHKWRAQASTNAILILGSIGAIDLAGVKYKLLITEHPTETNIGRFILHVTSEVVERDLNLDFSVNIGHTAKLLARQTTLPRNLDIERIEHNRFQIVAWKPIRVSAK
jgi:hypothetical protein